MLLETQFYHSAEFLCSRFVFKIYSARDFFLLYFRNPFDLASSTTLNSLTPIWFLCIFRTKQLFFRTRNVVNQTVMLENTGKNTDRFEL